MQKENYKIIDSAKLFFCICIICLHTGGLSFFYEEYKFYIEKFILRMAVPFFFTCSGFFLGKKIKLLNNKLNINSKEVKKYCSRLIKPLIIFESIYILLELFVNFIKRNNLLEVILKIIQSIIFYPKASLWYIQAIIISCIIIYILSKYITIIQLILLSTFLYFILLLCNNYYFLIENTIIQKIVDGYLNIAISARNGIFMGIPFLTIGILVEKRWKNYIKICKYFLIISLLFYIFEIYLLKTKIYVDDGGVYLIQIFCAPILLINLLAIEKNKKIVLSEEKSILFRNLSSGMYFLHRIILYIFECILAIFKIKLDNSIIFLLVLFFSFIICRIAYKYPILKFDKLLK